MKKIACAAAALLAIALPQGSSAEARTKACRLSPKTVVTRFVQTFYIEKKVREAFETWVVPGYIQHNPMARTGRDAAIAFLEPFFANTPGLGYELKRIIADGNLVAVHARMRKSPEDRGSAVVDILRVEGCKIVEHWDVIQPVPETSANNNTMF